jgi:hypothetical protein
MRSSDDRGRGREAKFDDIRELTVFSKKCFASPYNPYIIPNSF